MKKILFIILSALIFSVQIIEVKGSDQMEHFQLFSKAFQDGGDIPERYSSTRKGQNISPPLHWVDPPTGTKSFAIITDDLDIPFGFIFTHWVVYNIPALKQELSEGVPHQRTFSDGAIQGKNSYGKNEYLGPNPIVGGKHRYVFYIYALDRMLNPDPDISKKKLLKVMEGHILGQAQLMGCYSKA
ncbi:MAG TPA: YbhB/YbcL family Raf kinase inhibitor-like protein [Bacillota bacterium]|nr:YbhB/YbcL family Raf kinase inhibitor-like protein [Bacillota bacterium]